MNACGAPSHQRTPLIFGGPSIIRGGFLYKMLRGSESVYPRPVSKASVQLLMLHNVDPVILWMDSPGLSSIK